MGLVGHSGGNASDCRRFNSHRNQYTKTSKSKVINITSLATTPMVSIKVKAAVKPVFINSFMNVYTLIILNSNKIIFIFDLKSRSIQIKFYAFFM